MSPLYLETIELKEAWKHVDGILASYDEIILKSHAVRRKFEKKLVENMKSALKSAEIPYKKVIRGGGRVFVQLENVGLALTSLRRIFGLSWLAPTHRLETTKLEDILRFCKENYEKWIPEGKTFAVRTKRVGVLSLIHI